MVQVKRRSRIKKKGPYHGKVVRDYLIANGWTRHDTATMIKGDPVAHKIVFSGGRMTIYNKIFAKEDGKHGVWDIEGVLKIEDMDLSYLKTLTRGIDTAGTPDKVILDMVGEIVSLEDENVSKYFFCLKLLDIAEKIGYKVDEVLVKAILANDDVLIQKLLGGG